MCVCACVLPECCRCACSSQVRQLIVDKILNAEENGVQISRRIACFPFKYNYVRNPDGFWDWQPTIVNGCSNKTYRLLQDLITRQRKLRAAKKIAQEQHRLKRLSESQRIALTQVNQNKKIILTYREEISNIAKLRNKNENFKRRYLFIINITSRYPTHASPIHSQTRNNGERKSSSQGQEHKIKQTLTGCKKKSRMATTKVTHSV